MLEKTPPKCPNDNSIAKWLEIDDEMKELEKYYWGWYCPVCFNPLSKIGVR